MDLEYNTSIINDAVEKEIKIIEENKNDPIILIGKGTGRKYLLNNLNKSENLKYNYMNIYLEPLKMFDEKDEGYNKEVVDTYYELRFARALLKQLNEKYAQLDSYTKRLNASINNELKDFDNAYNKYYIYDDYTTISNLKYTKKILNNYRELNDKKIALIMMKFDSINDNDLYTQKYLKQYFDYFDKVVITSDDETLQENEKIHKINYDLNAIEQIVRYQIHKYINGNDILSYKKDMYFYFMNQFINQDNIKYLYNEFNGNIQNIIDVYRYFIVFDYKFETDIKKLVSNIKESNDLINQCTKKVKLYVNR